MKLVSAAPESFLPAAWSWQVGSAAAPPIAKLVRAQEQDVSWFPPGSEIEKSNPPRNPDLNFAEDLEQQILGTI
jgi:hypothetical protein